MQATRSQRVSGKGVLPLILATALLAALSSGARAQGVPVEVKTSTASAAGVATSTESAPSAGVEESTDAVKQLTVAQLYPGGKLRDPFLALAPGSGGGHSPAPGQVAKKWDPNNFNIHEVDLKGIQKDKSGVFAILVERGSGASLTLRKGRLYDEKNKRIEGVRGTINFTQNSAYLVTSGNDVQPLRLRVDEDKEKEEEEGDDEGKEMP